MSRPIDWETKKIFLFIACYFFLAWILAWTYYTIHVNTFAQYEAVHEHLLAGTFPLPIGDGSTQFRLLGLWLPELFHHGLGLSLTEAYIAVRFIFTFLIFCLFHLFVRKWFNDQMSFLAVVFLAAITPVTYLAYYQESDVILQFFFLAGLWCTRERRLLATCLILIVGTFAKETMVFLVPFYFILHWQKEGWRRLAGECVLLLAVWAGTFYLTRHAFYQGVNSPLWQLPYNIHAVKTYFTAFPLTNPHLLWVPFLGIFWFLLFKGFKAQPLFFQRAAIFTVVFMVLYFLFAWPEEARILVPIIFLAIPAGWLVLFPQQQVKQNTA